MSGRGSPKSDVIIRPTEVQLVAGPVHAISVAAPASECLAQVRLLVVIEQANGRLLIRRAQLDVPSVKDCLALQQTKGCGSLQTDYGLACQRISPRIRDQQNHEADHQPVHRHDDFAIQKPDQFPIGLSSAQRMPRSSSLRKCCGCWAAIILLPLPIFHFEMYRPSSKFHNPVANTTGSGNHGAYDRHVPWHRGWRPRK